MNKKMSLREAFGKALVKIGRNRKDFVVFDADVAGGTGTYHFRDTFPERFFQFGIAEQNMFAAAAGFSTLGITPIVTTYAVFASMRAIEQVRNSIAYPKLNVKIVASHPGLDTGPDGATHQAVEDLAIYRAIPNMVVISPADPVEVEKATEAILDYPGPVYMRTGRSPVPIIFDESYKFEIGRANTILEGEDVSLFATGIMLHRALEVAQYLRKYGIYCEVVNISTLKPLDKETIIRSARKTKAVITMEDHNVIGGLAGAISEILSYYEPTLMRTIGIKDCFGESGEPNDLVKKYHLDRDSIIKIVEETVAIKNKFMRGRKWKDLKIKYPSLLAQVEE